MDKDSLKEYIEKHYFSLEYDLDDLRKIISLQVGQ